MNTLLEDLRLEIRNLSADVFSMKDLHSGEIRERRALIKKMAEDKELVRTAYRVGKGVEYRLKGEASFDSSFPLDAWKGVYPSLFKIPPVQVKGRYKHLLDMRGKQ